METLLVQLVFILALSISGLFCGLALASSNCLSSSQLKIPYPENIVTIDISTTEIALALGLADRISMAAGINDPALILAEYRRDFAKIPQVFPHYLSYQDIIDANPDLVIAGWNYGFSLGTKMSPDGLSRSGISSYVIRESCVHEMPLGEVSIRSAVFADILAISKLTASRERGEQLTRGMEQRLESVEADVERYGRAEPYRVFVYDSSPFRPFTIGGHSVLNSVIASAGGVNIFAARTKSWLQVDWQEVAAENPEVILIVDYGFDDGRQKRRLLEGHAELQGTDAVVNGQFFILPYSAAVSGVRSVGLSKLLADHLICTFSSHANNGDFLCLEQAY